MPSGYGGLLCQALENYLLFYAGNKVLCGDNRVVVNGYAVDSNANKELGEVRQVGWAFAAY
jgi:hypothetical protein